MVTLNQIQNFVILAQELHFTRAAAKLHLPQPVLSKEIQKLEAGIGCQLFDRSRKRNITLTEAGKAYFRNIRNVPGKIQEAAAAALRANSGKTGELSISVSSFVYELSNTTEVMKRYIAQYPDVKIKMAGTPNCFLAYQDAEKGEADVGVFAVPQNFEKNPELEYLPIVRTELVIAVSPNDPLAQKKHLKMSDLKEVPFIFGGTESHDWILKDFEHKFWLANKSSVKASQEVWGAGMIKFLVEAGMGAAIFAHTNEKVATSMKAVFVPLEEKIPIYIMAAWRKTNTSPVLKNLISVATQVNCDIWGENAICGK